MASKPAWIGAVSDYFSSLDSETKTRYIKKMKDYGLDSDPLLNAGTWSRDQRMWPQVTYPDVCNYLVFTRSAYTNEEMKAFKSMEAYKYVVAGYVSEVESQPIKNKRGYQVVRAKVRHGQKQNAEPLTPWVIIQDCGIVEAAHCTCMAGLGESCSHVGALLFFLKATWERVSEVSCTSKPCEWTAPSKKAAAAELSKMDFTSPARVMAMGSRGQKRDVSGAPIPTPSDDEKENFLAALQDANSCASVLAVSPGYAENFVEPPLPVEIDSLYDPSLVGKPYDELVVKAEEVLSSMTCSREEQVNAELRTRQQRDSKDWYVVRTGRVTASNFKQAVATDPLKPAKSVLVDICTAAPRSFLSPATEWGKTHEKGALTRYRNVQVTAHKDFTLRDAGVTVSMEVPYVAASPDGVVSCECCGAGVVEVKCPYRLRDVSVDEFVADKQSCMVRDASGAPALDRNHAYFYQVQMQMFCCGVMYCDFVVSTTKFMLIHRVKYDPDFMRQKVEKVRMFMSRAVLPQVMGRHFFGK